MDLIHKFMNIALPPITLFILPFFLPPYFVFKFLSFIKRYLCSENVAGKVVLITGAASGIGEQMAYEYARRGACLVLVDIREEHLGAVLDKARHLGSPDAIVVQADVSKVEDSKRFIDAAVNHFGRLDHLVNNAGILGSKWFVAVDHISDFTSIMDINFWGTVYGTHFAIPHLRKRKGKIIVTSSTCGWYPLPGLSFYNASKAAVINFYETLRTEIGGEVGITIVTPGVIKSEMTQGEKLRQVGMHVIPMESKEECAKAIVRRACRGDNYVVEPSWVKVLHLAKAFCPEVTEYCNRWVFITRTRTKMMQSLEPKAD